MSFAMDCRVRPRRATIQQAYLENRIHRAAPRPVEFLQQFLGRRDAARDDLFERPQIARLVAAVAIEPLARAPARCAQASARLLRQIVSTLRLPICGLEAEPRHVIAQLLPLVRASNP